MGPLDREVIDRRLLRLEKILKALNKHSKITVRKYLENEDLQAIVERRLQLAAQVCIDIANYLIARLNLEIPDEEENVFIFLSKSKIISKNLAERMRGLVRFRNILVHEYLEIDPEIVFYNFKDNLKDFKIFAKEVNLYLEKNR